MLDAMDRREFCRLAGCAMIGVCAASVTGCARLLEWSDAQRGAGAVERSMSSLQSPEPTRAAEATSSPEPALPDLAVFRGEDPAANVRAALAAAGGMERFVARGSRVVIKPNVLTSRSPEYAATTNPDVVGELTRMALEAGAAEVVVLDRPTAPQRTAFETSGILAAVQSAGGTVKFLENRNFENVAIPDGRVLTEWPLVTDVFEADTFINVPIAKTHGLAGLTMAMKNLMGIMGGTRGLVHQDFHQKIVDLATLVKPHLVVLDAHRILTANGPTGGNLADVALKQTVVVGTNQTTVDAYGTTLFGRAPADLPYLVKAQEQGLGETDLTKLLIAEGTS
jgi:uncharacterized protein (DUF362 family)